MTVLEKHRQQHFRAKAEAKMSDTTKKWMPMEVSNLEMAFPASVSKFMPPMEEIPEEFHRFGFTKWNQLVADWFFSGLSKLDLKPKEGIDMQKAIRHIKTILGSFEPKHEHKEAACAFLLSEWFEDATWEPAKRKSA